MIGKIIGFLKNCVKNYKFKHPNTRMTNKQILEYLCKRYGFKEK
jgi:hypothetical protein